MISFLQISEHATSKQVDDLLVQLNEEVVKHEKNPDVWQTTCKFQKLDQLHYGTGIGIFDNTPSPANMKTLRILLGVAIALLVIAIFNFINLETAQAVGKSKEVSLSKNMSISKPAIISR